MSWEARLKELGQAPTESQVGWLDKFLYEEDVLVDALVWKDELLAVTSNRIIQMIFRDGGKHLQILNEGFLDEVTTVSYNYDVVGFQVAAGSGFNAYITMNKVKLDERLVEFYESLIKAVGRAKARQ